MTNTITGFLLFKKPNKYTKQSTVSPSIFTIPIQCNWNSNIPSADEIFAVGTQSGSSLMNQARVDEYTAWRQGKISIDDIIFKNNIILDVDEYYTKTRSSYLNEQMRKWFGNDLYDYF
jgi:hypothetical protein